MDLSRRHADRAIANASPFDLSLELLRREHPERYAQWVLTGAAIGVLGYLASCLAIVGELGWPGLWRTSNPYVVLVDLLAIALVRVGHARSAAMLALASLWVDMHFSLATQGGAFVVPGAMLAPVFVLGASLLLGGRAAFAAAGLTAVTIPVALHLSIPEGAVGEPGSILDPLLLVTLIGSLAATCCMLAAFLHSFSGILLQSQANERRAHELIEEAPDAIIALSNQGRIEAFNGVAERLLNVPRDAVIGRPHTDLPLHAETGEWSADIQQLAHARGVVALRVGDGATRLEALVRATTRSDGSEGLMLVLRDVTQRYAAEAHARALQTQLQHAQKLEAVGLLAGGIAHDFNNLLTAIGGFGSLVVRSKDDKTRQYGEEIVAAQERGAALVRQLLAFARRDVPQPRPLDVGRTLRDMSALIERLVGEHIRVKIEIAGPCPILSDPGHLEQVILNLAANARDAMPQGGTLRLTCEATDTQVSLHVEDSGYGIDPEIQARIFEPFFTTKSRGKGTGLGLSTVHGIVSEAGARIEVSSEPGRGTRFSIHWPRSSVAPESRRSSHEFRVTAQPGCHILLVEDHPAARRYVTELLRGYGYEVDVASDAEVALRLMEGSKSPPDLLLSDVVMPGMSGPQLAQLLHRRWPDLRVLFMSGYLGDVTERHGLDARHDRHDLIAKPFTETELLDKIGQKLAEGEHSQARLRQRQG
jgi:two-component system cell cycle sensor histidine kinase/response regulator CckA